MTKVVRTHSTRRRIWRVEEGRSRERDDQLVAEEPLEIRLISAEMPAPGGDEYIPVAVTMRTPGNDFELAAGFLFTEGIVASRNDIKAVAYCGDLVAGVRTVGPRFAEERYNVVNVYLRPGVHIDRDRLQRNFYTTSSCGVCGKASLEAVRVQGVAPVADDVRVTPEVLAGLGDSLREAQRVFDRTGGLHAAGLFDVEGHLHVLREDVGRHNAVEKLIGHAFLEDRLPLERSILMVSGRAGFEIVQKAAVAGVPVIAAISAPSSLARDAAAEFNMTLVGFLRDERFNIYSVPERIVLGQSL